MGPTATIQGIQNSLKGSSFKEVCMVSIEKIEENKRWECFRLLRALIPAGDSRVACLGGHIIVLDEKGGKILEF
ncbi:hypothetical protein A2V80_01785 [Candidatus Woesebacteria bacterium RBG_16_39_8b]|uniref:Uncharacterized protein n=1 Tax=Candidatus Woesebacteria bacterium RBG_16_39_8b TaxID=1802482 RepID=A0A1F7XAH7_9BACT|nr:MAG: hypothetical protein A2V80_01785 [Candidatus Woesebacteria bacterium RBG_16_39_8b]